MAKLTTDKEIDKLEKQFEQFDASVKDLTKDRLDQTSKQASESPLSQKAVQNSNDVYLKPVKSVSSPQKFNEAYRERYNHDKVYVPFIAENKEIIGEDIDIWTRPYGGMPAEEWIVPTNKPVWGPRYLAEQIKRKYYHRLVMKDNVTRGGDHAGTYYGQMAADTTIQRLDAHPAHKNKSVFMGADNF